MTWVYEKLQKSPLKKGEYTIELLNKENQLLLKKMEIIATSFKEDMEIMNKEKEPGINGIVEQAFGCLGGTVQLWLC